MGHDLHYFCNKYCASIRKFQIYEVTRYEYCFTSSTPLNLRRAVCEVARQAGAEIIDSRWGPYIVSKENLDNVSKFLSWAKSLGVTVHTLEEHVEFMKRYVESCKIEDILSAAERTEFKTVTNARPVKVFDPDSRKWRRIEKIGLSAPYKYIVIRNEEGEYFCTDGSTVWKIDKDKAYLIASRYYKPRSGFYVVDKENGVALVRAKDLGLLPTEVFDVLIRVQPYPQKGKESFIYWVNDLPLVKEILKSVKTYLLEIHHVEKIPVKRRSIEVPVVDPLSAIPHPEFEIFLSALEILGLTPSLMGTNILLKVSNGKDYIRCVIHADSPPKVIFSQGILLVPACAFRGFSGLYRLLKLCRTKLSKFTHRGHWPQVITLMLNRYREFQPEDRFALAEIALTALQHEDVMRALANNQPAIKEVKQVAATVFFGKTGTALDSASHEGLRRLLAVKGEDDAHGKKYNS